MAVIYSWCLSLGFSHCRPYCRNLKRKLERLVAWRENGDHVVNIGRRRKKTWNPHPNLQFSRTSLQPSSLVKSTPCPHHCEDYNVHFTKGVKPNVQLKSSIPIGAKIEISPKGFTLGVKAEIENFNLSQCWTLWPCIGPKVEKGIPLNWFGKPICNPWGQGSNIY